MKKLIQDYFDRRLSKKIVNRFLSSDKNMWLVYEHYFNRWQFHDDFYDLMPKWMRSRNRGKRTTERFMTIFRAASKLVNEHFTEKEQLRYHNVHVGKMTDAEFDYWYSVERFSKTIENYYMKRFEIEKIEWWKDDVFEKIINALK